jgi:formate hydrogenlyase subunit 3/multisubunit Na+/H+ antiporter MnhD subunit
MNFVVRAAAERNRQQQNLLILFLLFFHRFRSQSGFIPMHTWLPWTLGRSSAVSALMSEILIKTGIYGILRIILIIGIPAPGWLTGVWCRMGNTALLGVMNAHRATNDLKSFWHFTALKISASLELASAWG